jgi:hypothetical protein
MDHMAPPTGDSRGAMLRRGKDRVERIVTVVWLRLPARRRLDAGSRGQP